MRIGIDCGHTASGPGAGAVGYLNESRETRAVGNALMEMLTALGHTVYDCTNHQAPSVSANLSRIVAAANARNLDAFYSIHFNAGGGLGSEVYTMTGKETKETAGILAALEELGFRNRGTKRGSHLYVIHRTTAPATLIEVCFVDSESDSKLYQNLGAKAVAAAICKGITGKIPEEKEGLSVTQYQELKAAIDSLAQEIREIKNPTIYNFIDDTMPIWAVPSVKKMVAKGILRGTGSGLGLTEGDLRQIVWNDRAGVYD